MNPLFKRLILFLVPLLLVGAGIFHFSVPAVVVASASKETATHAVPGNLRVIPTEWSVRTQASGIVLENDIQVGDQVKENQVLLKLDTTDIETDLALAKKSLEVARKKKELPSANALQLEIEKLNLGKTKDSMARGVVSEVDLQRQERLVANLEELVRLDALGLELAVANASTHLARLEKNFQRCNVTAPVTGVVTYSPLLAGSLAVHNMEVFRVQSDEMKLEVRINEDDFHGVRVDVPAKVRFYSYGNRIFHGRVTKILPEADAATQEYLVHLEVDMGGEALYAGMSGEASLVLGSAPDAIVIPRRALLGNKVFVVSAGRVKAREVQIGFLGLNKVQIISGLEPGEHVVVENLDMVRTGGRVRVTK